MSTNHVMTCKQYTKTQDMTHPDTYNYALTNEAPPRNYRGITS